MYPLIDHGQQPMKMHTELTLLYKYTNNTNLPRKGIKRLPATYGTVTMERRHMVTGMTSLRRTNDMFISRRPFW